MSAQDPAKTGSISTDKLDYQPGETVTITGQDWTPGETVRLVLQEVGTGAPDLTMTAVAAADGTFVSRDFTPEQRHLGVKFNLKATGETSGETASLQFFDAITSSNLAGDYGVTISTGTLFRGTRDVGNHINDGTTVLAVRDGTMPFAAKLYGQSFSFMAVSSNGLLQFGSNNSSYSNDGLENQLDTGAAGLRFTIAPYWDDLTTVGTSPLGATLPLGIFTAVEGSAPNRIFHVEWRAVRASEPTRVENFEVRLFENSTRFEIIYGRTDRQGSSATVGVVREHRSNYTQYSFHEASLSNGLKLVFDDTTADTTAPVVQVPADMTVAATGASGAVATFTATATDDVDGSVTASCNPASGSQFVIGTTTVTCEATDAAGNKGSATFKVTVGDKGAPVGPEGQVVTAEATSAAGAAVEFTSSATDDIDGELPGTCTPASGSTFKLGSTTVSCEATDKGGNTGKWTITVIVKDETAPELKTPADITEEATSPAGAVVTFSATATDLVDGSITPLCSPASGSRFRLGTTEVKCSATDAVGNTIEGKFKVTVSDTKPPLLTVPADMVKEATSAAGALATFTATATDAVDEAPVVECKPPSGSTFPLGNTQVSCTARDASGNASDPKTFQITVQDTTKPDLKVPANMIEEATSGAGVAVSFAAAATDLVDGNVAPVCTPASGSTFRLGQTTVNCTATDKAGNEAADSFTVTVVDTTPPALTVPSGLVAEALSAAGAPVTFSATAIDLVDGPVAATCQPASGSTFALGITTVNCSARDAAGNVGANSFAVKVQDTTAPVLTLPADISVVATSSTGQPVQFVVSAFDTVAGAVSPVCSLSTGATISSGYSFPLGAMQVTCAAVDGYGNRSAGTFNVKVAYSWSGYLQPINVDPQNVSVFKLGSTVPVKFQLTGASAVVNNAIAKLSVARITDAVVGTEAEAISTSAATVGNLFRYDATANLYIFNWGTKSGQLSVGTYQLRVDLGDGVPRTVLVSLR